MFKDIRIFKDDEVIEYDYKIENNLLLFSIDNIDNKQCKTLKIIYDENIYEISFEKNIKNENLKAGEILIHLAKDATIFSFYVNINYKFFIKTIYKFLNKFIDKETLIQEIDIFRKSKIGEKYKKELTELLDKIENTNVSIEEFMNMLLNNELYISLAKQMNDQDLMLLITYYISAPVVPSIDQDAFDDLVNSAIQYDYSLENVWRLGMNYDCRDYNYNLLDEFFVNSKDSWYLAEYISGVTQVNQEKIVNMIIQTKDNVFIKRLLEDNFIQIHLEEKYKDVLKQALIDIED